MRVELPDLASATSLTQELFGRFHVELVQHAGKWQVEVPEPAARAAPEVLSAVERWLTYYGLDEVTVQLDEDAHTVRRPSEAKSVKPRRS